MEGGEGRDVCTMMADLYCCMAKTNTILLKFIYIYIFLLIEKKVGEQMEVIYKTII